MNQQQLWVEPVGHIIIARIRGQCSEEILRECHDRVLELVRETGQARVLYDALEMGEPTVDLALFQEKMDAEARNQPGATLLRRAVLVTNTRAAFLARLAFGQFGEGGYRVFYNDLAQAIIWLESQDN